MRLLMVLALSLGAPATLSASSLPATLPADSPATQPASPPATRPDTLSVDLSTPRKTLRSLIVASRFGDAAGARQCFLFKDPAEEEIYRATIEPQIVELRLIRHAVARFGAEGREQFPATNAMEDALDEQVKNIDTLELKQDGPAATLARVTPQDEKVDPDDPTALISLRLIAGQWKIVATPFVHPPEEGELASLKTTARAQIRLYQTLDADLAAGKIPSAKILGERLDQGMLEVVGQTLEDPEGAATHPALPSTPPSTSSPLSSTLPAATRPSTLPAATLPATQPGGATEEP